MIFPAAFIPPLPQDTALAARSLFGKGNFYLKLGEHLDEIFEGVADADIGKRIVGSDATTSLYALMTVFQYVEGMTDRQILDAVRNRVDLKYALHLPLIYSPINPGALCAFRQQIHSDIDQRRIFQRLLDRLEEHGFLQGFGECGLSAIQVVDALCTGNRFESVVEAMLQALESLAATHGTWLRKIARPYWYIRYNRQTRLNYWHRPIEKWQKITVEIAGDIQYLLEQIDQSDTPSLEALPTIRELKSVWTEQFAREDVKGFEKHSLVWRPTRCAACQGELCAREEAESKATVHIEHQHFVQGDEDQSSKMLKGEWE